MMEISARLVRQGLNVMTHHEFQEKIGQLEEEAVFIQLRDAMKTLKTQLKQVNKQRSQQISELLSKLGLAIQFTNLELQKQKEITAQFSVDSLDQRIYFKTQEVYLAEINRRREVGSNIKKLWLAFKTLV